MIRFQRLEVEDFGVISRAVLGLDGQGLVLVRGENFDTDAADSNGSGKTTLFKALTWALFGRFVGEGSETEVVRVGAKRATVAVEFSDDDHRYRVQRDRDRGSKLQLWTDGISTTGRLAADTQRVIEGILGLDWLAFRNTVLYGQGDIQRFADPGTSDGDRKLVLKRILRLELIDAALKLVKEDLSAKNNEILAAQSRVVMAEKFYQRELEAKQRADRNHGEWQQQHTIRQHNAAKAIGETGDLIAAIGAALAHPETGIAPMEREAQRLSAVAAGRPAWNLEYQAVEAAGQALSARREPLQRQRDARQQQRATLDRDLGTGQQRLQFLHEDRLKARQRRQVALQEGQARIADAEARAIDEAGLRQEARRQGMARERVQEARLRAQDAEGKVQAIGAEARAQEVARAGRQRERETARDGRRRAFAAEIRRQRDVREAEIRRQRDVREAEIRRLEGERAAEIRRLEGERAAEIRRLEDVRAAEIRRLEDARAAEIGQARDARAAEIRRLEQARAAEVSALRARFEQQTRDRAALLQGRQQARGQILADQARDQAVLDRLLAEEAEAAAGVCPTCGSSSLESAHWKAHVEQSRAEIAAARLRLADLRARLSALDGQPVPPPIPAVVEPPPVEVPPVVEPPPVVGPPPVEVPPVVEPPVAEPLIGGADGGEDAAGAAEEAARAAEAEACAAEEAAEADRAAAEEREEADRAVAEQAARSAARVAAAAEAVRAEAEAGAAAAAQDVAAAAAAALEIRQLRERAAADLAALLSRAQEEDIAAEAAAGQQIADTGQQIAAWLSQQAETAQALTAVGAALEQVQAEEDALQARRADLRAHNEALARAEGALSVVAQALAELRRQEQQIGPLQARMQAERQVAASIAAEQSPYLEDVAHADAQAARARDDLDEAGIALDDLQRSKRPLDFWRSAFDNKGLPSILMDDVMPLLTSKANHYLSILTDGDIRVQFSTGKAQKGDPAKVDERIQMRITIEGLEDVPASGGQRSRINLAVDLALMDLVAMREGVRVDLLLLDEVLDGLDGEGHRRVVELLRHLRGTHGSIFVIAHDTSLQEHFERVVTVRKERGGAELVT